MARQQVVQPCGRTRHLILREAMSQVRVLGTRSRSHYNFLDMWRSPSGSASDRGSRRISSLTLRCPRISAKLRLIAGALILTQYGDCAQQKGVFGTAVLSVARALFSSTATNVRSHGARALRSLPSVTLLCPVMYTQAPDSSFRLYMGPSIHRRFDSCVPKGRASWRRWQPSGDPASRICQPQIKLPIPYPARP